MLIVIGVLAALLVAIVPAVSSLSKSGARRGAVSNILGAIEQARGLAIKDGRPTYVVFSTSFSSTDPSVIQRYAHRGYAVFEDDPNNPPDHTNTADPADGTKPKIQITAWRSFPTGVSLRKDMLSSPWKMSTFSFQPGGSGAMESFPYLMFDTNGELDSPDASANPSNTVALTIFEGTVKNGQELITSTKNSLGGPASIEQLTVSRNSGRAEKVPSPSPQP
jgi:hypothetical protein